MFRIGEFSKMSKTTIKTLRYYDDINLLKPEKIEKLTSYRIYTTKQLVQLHKIQSLRQIGLSIDHIKKITMGDSAKAVLENHRKELLEKNNEIENQLSRLDFILQEKEEDLFMNYVATVKELPRCIVYSKKMTIPNYDAYFEVLPPLGKQVMEKYPDLKCTVPEYCFVIYLDKEYREKNIRIEFCESVNQLKPDFDEIVFKEIEAVTALSVIHKGSYADLSKAYAFAFQWIEENGYEIGDAPRESYIDGIWNKESEDEWLTELQFPIKKK